MVVTPGDPFPANVLPENTQVPSKEELLGDVTFQDMVIKYEVPVVHVAPETVVHVLPLRVNELLAADLYNNPPETEPAVVADVADVADVAVAALPVVFWFSVGKLVKLAADPLGANTSVPITKPRFVLAPDVVVAPVPPEATASVADRLPAEPVVFWLSVGNVQLAKLPEVGVPKIGVTSVGLVASAFAPEPVEVVTPVPPLATAKVPVMSAVLRLIASQLVFVPSVCKYLLALLVWLGSSAFKAALAVTCPVPPLAMASVPVRLAACSS